MRSRGLRGIAADQQIVPLAWAALGVIYIVWGSTYLAIRIAIETMPPMLMGSTRFLIAGSILYGFAIRRGDREGDRPGPAQWRSAAVVGTLLFLGGNGGVVWAEQHIPSGVAALIVATVPLWMALFAFVALRERLRGVAVAGLVVGFAGTALLIRPSGSGGTELLGAMAVVGASIAWSIGSLYARRAPLPKRPLVSAAMQLLCGGASMGVVAILGGELGRVDLAAVSRSSALSLLYLIGLGTLVAFPCYAWLLQNAPTSLVSTYAYVNPVVAVALGWAIAGEHVEPLTVVAGGIIVVAVAMIVSARPSPKPRETTIAGEAAAGAPPIEGAVPETG